MNRMPSRAVFFLLLICISVTAAGAQRINLREPIRLPDDQAMKAIYFFPHWWDPWKSDDDAVSADLRAMRELGFNTVCLDHEVSQAIDREWYWLDREYRLAAEENMLILPWLQLQSVDRQSLMKFSHLQLQAAVNQDGQTEEDCVVYRDSEFRKALAHYVTVYLDRYANDPALLRIKDGRTVRPVVGLMLETGWRSIDGLPLSFDEDTNNYFRRWMRSSYHDLKHLNSQWGTDYKSFDEIDPCDKAIFDYAFEDKDNMPVPVQVHTAFRARLITDALKDVVSQVRKRHKDVLFVAEVAYPFSADHPAACAYRWNNANEPRAVDFADIVFVRTVGNTSTEAVKKEQDAMMLHGKRLVLAYRLFDDSHPGRAVAFGLDCASSANALAYYNWNEAADDISTIHDKPDRQALVKLMVDTYDMLYDSEKRHEVSQLSAAAPAFEPPVAADLEPEPVSEESDAEEAASEEEPLAELAPAPVPLPAEPAQIPLEGDTPAAVDAEPEPEETPGS